MERVDPSPRCCYGADCTATDGGNHAVVTMIRTDQYLGLTQVPTAGHTAKFALAVG